MTREQRLVLAIAVLGSFVSFLDGTLATVALPAIRDELGGGLSSQQWIVDAYLITLGALILIAGSLSDVYGRIVVLRVGLIGFGITSALIAAAPTVEFIVVMRALQGVAGALLVPSSLALIMSNFRDAAQARAIGSWTGWTSVAQLVGPVVGGGFIDLLSWRAAFLVNVVPIAICLVLLARLEQRDVRRPGATIDYPGAVLAVVGLGGTVFALIEQGNLGWASPAIWGPMLVGVLALAAFLRRQATTAQPILPLGLFRVRNFAWGNLATTFIYAALSLSGFVIVVYLQQGAGFGATVAGLAMIPTTILMIGLSSTFGRLSGRYGPRLFMTAGPLLAGAGFLLMLSVTDPMNYWTQMLPGVILFGLGLTVTVAPLTSAVLGAVAPERAGIASAVNNAISRVAGLVAVAMVGTIVGGMLDLAGFYRGLVVSALLMGVGAAFSFIGIRTPTAEPAER
ncbi:MFS transporter [Occultella glacieicola]|uniref:MFS transporter n=1 Tax=Occultella glacieicola TaxID=2518684 RepID=A0ABY2E3F5_9MICO|nr:MFS transporter [Occultella glacieicola]TDE92734.1 MFS transporter [Occultella glacieicola]